MEKIKELEWRVEFLESSLVAFASVVTEVAELCSDMAKMNVEFAKELKKTNHTIGQIAENQNKILGIVVGKNGNNSPEKMS